MFVDWFGYLNFGMRHDSTLCAALAAICRQSACYNRRKTHSDIYDVYDNEAPSPSATIRGEYGNMRSDEIKSSLREGVVERSIPILRSQGMSDEKIKEKMVEAFSLDEETIDRLLSH